MNIRSEDQFSGLAISLMTVASTLTVANVYFNQLILPVIAAELGTNPGSVAKIGGNRR